MLKNGCVSCPAGVATTVISADRDFIITGLSVTNTDRTVIEGYATVKIDNTAILADGFYQRGETMVVCGQPLKLNLIKDQSIIVTPTTDVDVIVSLVSY